MNKTNIRLSLVFIVLFSCQNVLAWRAGFDSQPLPGTDALEAGNKSFCMAGYGTLCNREATGSLDPVGIQALFLTDENTESLLFISLDAIGFAQELANLVRQRIATETLLAEENIILTATHTHSSIDLQGLWGGLSDNQQQMVVAAIVEVARNAWINTQKVSLHVTTSNSLKGFNRRTKNNDIINQILTIQLRHDQGEPFATLFTLGAHPVVLDKENTRLSSDWIHFTRKALSDALGTPALFINGPLGDVLPGNGNPRTYPFAESYGAEIAQQILDSLKESRQLKSSLRYCSETIADKADNVSLIIATKALRNGTVEWKDLFSTSFQTRVSVVMLDDVVLLTTPGEPITAMGKALMALVHNHPVAVLGLTHDSLGYLIPEKDILDKGFEENVMISHSLGDKVSLSLQKLTTECLGKSISLMSP